MIYTQNSGDHDGKSEEENNQNLENVRYCSACMRWVRHHIECLNQSKNGNNGCTVYYCNSRHRAAHQSFHDNEHHSDFQKSPRFGMAGLLNLWNTCYMNSSVQCLSFIPELRSYLTSDDFRSYLNKFSFSMFFWRK